VHRIVYGVSSCTGLGVTKSYKFSCNLVGVIMVRIFFKFFYMCNMSVWIYGLRKNGLTNHSCTQYTVLMHFMLITLTFLLAVWVEWVVFLEVFSVSHNFIQFFLVRTCLMCFLLWSVMYPVAQNLFIYLLLTYFRQLHQETFFWSYMTLSVGIVLSVCIIEIHVLLW
jgi:hypothetical protein